MIERWLAKELTYRDASLEGFWIFSKGLTDFSGCGKTAKQGNALSFTPELTGGFFPRRVHQCNGRGGQYFDNTVMNYAGEVADFNYFISQPFSVSVWFCPVVDFYSYTNQMPLVSKTCRAGEELPYSFGWDLTVRSYFDPASPTSIATAVTFRQMTDTFYGYGIGVSANLEPISAQMIGRWHHLLVTKGSHKAEHVSIYYDGRPININITHDYFEGKGGNVTNRVWFGMKWDEFSSPVTMSPVADIDLIRIWKRELNAKQAREIYERDLMAYSYRKFMGLNLPSNNSLDLFLSGFDARTHSIPLYVSTIDYMYTLSPMPLFITGVPDVASLDLYTSGVLSQNQNTTLYTIGSPFFGTTDLFVSGVSAQTRNLNLYLHGKEPGLLNNSTELFVHGSTNPGMVGSAPLYTSGTQPFSTRAMNLFLLGHPTDLTVRNMNLWVNGTNEVVPESITLFLKNTQEGVEGSATLFIEAPGGVALAEDMNLFLKRPFEEMVTLFVEGPGTELVSPTMTLYTQSANTIQEDVTLVVPNTFGVLNPKMTLFVRGW